MSGWFARRAQELRDAASAALERIGPTASAIATAAGGGKEGGPYPGGAQPACERLARLAAAARGVERHALVLRWAKACGADVAVGVDAGTTAPAAAADGGGGPAGDADAGGQGEGAAVADVAHADGGSEGEGALVADAGGGALPKDVAAARMLAAEHDAVTRYGTFYDGTPAAGAAGAHFGGGAGAGGSAEASPVSSQVVPQRDGASGDGGDGGAAARGVDADTDASEPLGALSFREMLCRSRALEVLVSSFIQAPPANAHERADLASLLGAALLPTAASDASTIASELDELGTTAARLESEEMLSRTELLALAADALGALKPDVAKLRSAQVLRDANQELRGVVEAEVDKRRAGDADRGGAGEGAAAAADDDGDGDGDDDEGGSAAAEGGGGDGASTGASASDAVETSALSMATSLLKTTSRARAAAAVARPDRESLAEAAGRGAQRLARAEELVDTLDGDVAQLQAALTTCEKQQSDAEAYQEQRVAEIGGQEASAAADMASLSKARDELAAELADVEARLREAEGRHTKLAEERAEFEKSNGEMVAELQARNAALVTSVKTHSAELEAAKLWRRFLGAAEERAQRCRAEMDVEAAIATTEARCAAAAAAALGAERCREELVLALRRLEFCRAELASSATKQRDARDLGMAAVVEEMRAGRRALEHNYMECEQQVLELVHVGRSIAKQHELTSSALSPTGSEGASAGGGSESATSPPQVRRHDEAVKVALEGITALYEQFEAAPKPELRTGLVMPIDDEPTEEAEVDDQVQGQVDDAADEGAEAGAVGKAGAATAEPQEGGNADVVPESALGAQGVGALDAAAAAEQPEVGEQPVGQGSPATPASAPEALVDTVKGLAVEDGAPIDAEAAQESEAEAEVDTWLDDTSDGEEEAGEGLGGESDEDLQRAAAELPAAIAAGDDSGADGDVGADADDAGGTDARGEGAEATPGAAEGATAGAQAEPVDDGNAEDVDGEGHAGEDDEDAVAGAECSQMEPDAPESSRKKKECQSKNKN